MNADAAPGRPERDSAPRAQERIARFARSWFADNPVLVKEFRTRMRGARTYALLLVYTLLLTFVLGITYLEWVAEMRALGTGSPLYGWQAGRRIYYWVFAIQAVLTALITPALTAGAITLEREQRAYEMLVMTRLHPMEVVAGKLVAALAFVALLLTSSLPLLSLSFFFGGVSPGELLFTYLSLGIAALVYGAIGILWSSVVPSTAAATVLTYGSVFALGIVTAIPGSLPDSFHVGFRSVNPVTAVFRSVDMETFFAGQIPSWLGGVILNLLAGMLLAGLAARRLELFVGSSAAFVRVTATLLWLAFLLLWFGQQVGNPTNNWTAPGNVRQIALVPLAVAMAALAVITPIFTTGELGISPGESPVIRYLTGLLPHRMLRDDLSAGAPLVALWTVAAAAMAPLSFVLVGKAWFMPMLDTMLPAAILLFLYVAAIVAVGNLFSLILPNRWAALTMTHLAVVALTLLPFLGLIYWSVAGTGRSAPGPAWQFLYLVPFLGYWELIDPIGFAHSMPPMLFSRAPFWVVSSLAYTIIGGTAAALCLVALHRLGRRSSDIASPSERALEREGAAAS